MTIGDRAGILAVGAFAIIAGAAEIVVGLTGNSLGILHHSMAPSFAAGLAGAFYCLGGASILTLRKWGAAVGMVFIGAEIAARLYLVATGLAASRSADFIKIMIGAAIALAIIAYVAACWKKFS